MLKEASDCTDTWRLKTLLSYTVIPCHKSVLSHPLCTDKATKNKLIHTRNGERDMFFSFMSGLSRSLCHTPFFYLRYLFFIHQMWTEDTFFFCLGLVCLQFAIFSLVAFPAVWLWSSEELVNHPQHSHKKEFGVLTNCLLVVTQSCPSRKKEDIQWNGFYFNWRSQVDLTATGKCQGPSISWYKTVVWWWHFYGRQTQKLSPQLLPYLYSLW